MGSYIKNMFGSLWWGNGDRTLEEIQESYRQFGSGTVNLTLGEEGIAFLVLNNPEKRNAMSGKMMAEFRDAVEKLEHWSNGRAVLIHGAGLGFCSGGDLDFLKSQESPNTGSEFSRLISDALQRLSLLPLVSVCYVHGFGAIGGGAEISLAADFRVMSPGSRIGFVHGKMGLTPAWGGATRLIQIVGKEKALELLLTSRLVPSDEAREIGIAHKCGDITYAESFLKSLAIHSPKIIGALKSSLNGNEDETFKSVFGGEEHKRALVARVKHKD